MVEVEVKLRLPSAAAHQLLSDALAPRHVRTHLQENIFFDSPSDSLSSNLAALRLRFYNSDSRCVLSLKSRPSLSAGVSRVQEVEHDIDPALGRAVVTEPGRLLLISDSDIVKRVREEFGVEGLVCLGGFRNVRAVYEWEGLVLELDETHYGFGTSYELECETVEPEKAKEMLEGFLKENGVEYKYSEASKFKVFRAGMLLP